MGCSRPLAWSSRRAAKACFRCAFGSRLPAILHWSRLSSHCLRSGTPSATRWRYSIGKMLARARNDQVTRQLITIPGVGVVIALAYTYTAVIDDPARFRRSVSVGAYLGLTPGVTSPVRSTPLGTSRNAGTACYADISTKPPPCSYRDSRASVLKSWGLGLAKRIGMRRAKSRSRASSRSSCIGFGAIRANTVGRRYHRLPPEGHPQRQQLLRDPPTLGGGASRWDEAGQPRVFRCDRLTALIAHGT